MVLQKMQYQLDAIKFSEVWIGCTNLLNSMFDQTVTIYNKSTTNCFYPYHYSVKILSYIYFDSNRYQSEEWYNDGCCFTGIGWDHGCLPRFESVSIPTYLVYFLSFFFINFCAGFPLIKTKWTINVTTLLVPKVFWSSTRYYIYHCGYTNT